MEVGAALAMRTLNACALISLANRAGDRPPILGDRSECLCRLQFSGIPVLDLGCHQGAQNVGPVVARSTLQRFPRTNRLTDSLLSLAVELDSFRHHLFLKPLLLLLSVGGLLAGIVLWDFHELVFSP